MRTLTLLLLACAAVGCGPMQLSGNWSVEMDLAGGRSCSGVAALIQARDQLSGTLACSPMSNKTGQMIGTVVGSVVGNAVSLRWIDTGFTPALITATADDDRHLTGSANGSGMANVGFRASKN